MKQEKVINSPAPALACARVDCVQYSTQTSTQSGFIDKPICSQTTRARTREGLPPLRNPKAYFDAWRSATVGDSTDYLRIAVNVAYAILMHRPWGMTGIPRRTFFHAKKKVEDFLEACKHEAKSMSRQSRREKKLH